MTSLSLNLLSRPPPQASPSASLGSSSESLEAACRDILPKANFEARYLPAARPWPYIIIMALANRGAGY